MVSYSTLWQRRTMAFIYGVIIGITLVLYIEGMLSLFFPPFIMVVVIAPIVEEFFKTQAIHFDSPTSRDHVVGYVSMSAFGFGLIELFVHAIFTGTYALSLTPFLHILFSLPTAYAYRLSKRLYWSGLLISIMFHATWNLFVVIF